MNITNTRKLTHDGNWEEMQSPHGVNAEGHGVRISLHYDMVKPLNELANTFLKKKLDSILTKLTRANSSSIQKSN